MRKKEFFPIVLAVALVTTSCSTIQSQPGAEKVVLFTPEQVTHCTKLGTVKVSVLDKVGFISRDPAKVSANLQSLARNSAVDMAGDTITAASPVVEGKQSFNIFRCFH